MKRSLLVFLFLAGCSSSPSEKAEKDYAFIRANKGTRREVCEAARNVENAYREEQNAGKFKQAKLDADITCWPVDHG